MAPRSTKLKRGVAGFIGIGIAALGVGVALAVVIVQMSASVSSNEFATTTTTSSTTTTTIPAPSNGLQVSLSTGPGIFACGSFSTGPLTLSAIAFDLNSTSSQSSGQFLCVKNVGPTGISPLTIGVTTASSGEAGCSADEGTVDPEGVTCGTAGEMAGLLQFQFLKTDGNDTDCINAVTTGSMLGSGALGSGNTCVYSINLQFAGSPTYDQKLAASTDTAEFLIDVTALP